jgi:hypothetical protein
LRFSVIVACRLWVNGIAVLVNEASLFVADIIIIISIIID